MISTVMVHPPYTLKGELGNANNELYAIISFGAVSLFVHDPQDLLVLSDICKKLYRNLEVTHESDTQTNSQP